MAATGLAAWLAASMCLLPARGLAAEAEGDGKPLPAVDEAALAGHLKNAFEEGYKAGPGRLQEAQKHLALARRLAPADPRVDFASGLVFLKQSQLKPASAQFDAAVRRAGAPCWPAWQAAIWARLVEKQYEPGLKKLVQFAEMVQDSEKSDEVSEAQRDAARWTGQVLEALALSADSKKVHDLLAVYQMKVLKAFDDELAESLEAGRESLRDRALELEQAAGASRNMADVKKERRRQDKTARLDKGLEGLGKTRETTAKTAEEWKAWLDDVLAKSDKQLGLLERDYRFLEQRAQSLTQSMILVGREITALELTLGNQHPRAANSIARQNGQMQLMQRQNQMLEYQWDYNATIGRQQQIAEQADLAMQERAGAVDRYEAATGELVRKNADLDKWTARLNGEKKKLTIQKPAAGNGKKGAADQKPQLTLKSYLPLDLDVERNRVLASFASHASDDDNNSSAQLHAK
jgi:hypothetical protein